MARRKAAGPVMAEADGMVPGAKPGAEAGAKPGAEAGAKPGAEAGSDQTVTMHLVPDHAVADSAPTERPAINVPAMLGHVAWLMMASRQHKHQFLTDLEWLVVPPIVRGQFRIYQRNNAPFAFVSWAWLSPEVEQRLIQGGRHLKPEEWKSGDRLWMVDLVAPFGGAEGILRDLKEKGFPNHPLRTLRPRKDGQGVEVVEIQVGAAPST